MKNKILQSQIENYFFSDLTLKIFMVSTNFFFQDFFPISDFGHFFCPFLKNENISWKKKIYKLINLQSNLKKISIFQIY